VVRPRARLGQDPQWRQFLAESVPLLAQMHASVLIPSALSPAQ